MKKHNRGFTLIEMIVVAFIICIVVAIGCGLALSISGGGNHADPKTEMEQYMTALGYTPKGVVCTEMDTDHDGYVSCTGTYEEEGKIKRIAAECAGGWTLMGDVNEGCKQPKIGTIGNN